ncbi:MAG: envelope stress response membrane protein PspC [Novosphingobium sp.]|uniref:envelope stress response membrane protein PspC n=1 Tax=Novosphingobium sp. TaxID=1874826 RepID=UPI0032B85C03
MTSDRTRFYRDKINGKLMGVCAGIADYTGIDVLWVRLGIVGLVMLGAPFIVPAYFLTGLFAAKKPTHLYYTDNREQQFWQGVRQSPTRTARQVRSQMRDIDRRLAEVEAYYVSNNPRLSAEIEQLR